MVGAGDAGRSVEGIEMGGRPTSLEAFLINHKLLAPILRGYRQSELTMIKKITVGSDDAEAFLLLGRMVRGFFVGLPRAVCRKCRELCHRGGLGPPCSTQSGCFRCVFLTSEYLGKDSD